MWWTYPAVVTCVFAAPDPRLDVLRPGDRAAVRGLYTDASGLAPRLDNCRLVAVPADFNAPDPPIPLADLLRGARWWCPDFDPG